MINSKEKVKLERNKKRLRGYILFIALNLVRFNLSCWTYGKHTKC